MVVPLLSKSQTPHVRVMKCVPMRLVPGMTPGEIVGGRDIYKRGKYPL